MLALLLMLALVAPLQVQGATPDPPADTPQLEGVDPAHAGARLIVLLKSAHRAQLLDPASGATVAELPTGKGPHEVAVSPDGTLAVVANYGSAKEGGGGFVPSSSLTVIDLRTHAVVRTVELGEHVQPHGVQFLADGRRVAVTSEERQQLVLVDVTDGKVLAAFPTGARASHMLVLSPDETRAYVANIASGSVSVVDLGRGELLAEIETGAGCEGIDVTPDGQQVWTTNRAANTLSVIDAGRLRVVDELPCRSFPIRVKLTPDGKKAVVSAATSSEVVVFDTGSREELGRVRIERTVVEEAGGRLFGEAAAGSPLPIGVLIEPSGRHAWTAAANADVVLRLDLDALEIVAVHPTGPEPDGLGWAPALED